MGRLQRQHGELGIQYYEGGEWWTGFRVNMVSQRIQYYKGAEWWTGFRDNMVIRGDTVLQGGRMVDRLQRPHGE